MQGRRVLGKLSRTLVGEELIAHRAEACCEHLWRGSKVALAPDVIVRGVERGEAYCRYLLRADRVRLLVRVVTASVEAAEKEVRRGDRLLQRAAAEDLVEPADEAAVARRIGATDPPANERADLVGKGHLQRL